METAIYYAAKNADAQELVYKELKEYYKDKPNGFEVKDVKHLHHFKAFIYENMRINNVVQMAADRYVNQSGMKVAGYNIPKGSLVHINTAGIHFNPKIFGEDCDTFNMHRWLDDSKQFKMNPGFVLFGIGPRSCPGQSLALRELFSVLAPLLLRYKFTKPHDINHYNVTENWFQPNVPQLPLIVTKRV